MFHNGETKAGGTSTKPEEVSVPNSMNETFQREWLQEKPDRTTSDELCAQLEQAAYLWFEKRKNYRAEKEKKSHTKLRKISNFDLLQTNERNCEITFSIGKNGDRFKLKFKPTWERLERGQFYITTKVERLKNWAKRLNDFNATAQGGEFSYSFQAMEAMLLECEKSYMNMEDSQSSSSNSRKNLRQPTSEQFKEVWNAHDADTSRASDAKKRILLEFHKIKESNLQLKNGITVEMVHPNNPFLWRVLLRKFEGTKELLLYNYVL
jgi:hypothetical protein